MKNASSRLMRAFLAPVFELVAALRGDRVVSSTRGTVIIVDEHVPDPRLGAGYPRSRAIVEAIMQAGWAVTLLVTEASRYEVALFRALSPLRIRTRRARRLDGLFRVAQATNRPLAILVSRPVNLERLENSPGLLTELTTLCPVIYDAEAIFSEREARRRNIYPVSSDDWQLELALKNELDKAAKATVVVAVSDRDAEVFKRHGLPNVRVVGHLSALEPTPRPFSQRRGILFVGRLDGAQRSSPNVDSVCWFCESILPLLNVALGEAIDFHVVGEILSADVLRLSSDQIHLHGRVDDTRPFFDSCRIFVAPTRFSAGIPQKVFDAARRGLPSVTTSLLSQQAAFGAKGALLTADEPVGFAESCAKLYRDEALWTQVRETALRACARRYAPETFQSQVDAVLELTTQLSTGQVLPLAS